jgi:predicted flap endonuclease-1-like 5' DNA nuclease
LNKSKSAFSEAQGILSRILSQVEQEGSKAAREREGLRTRLRTLTAQFQEAESNLQQQAGEMNRLRESESMLRASLEQERESGKCREAELADAKQLIGNLQQKTNHQAERIAELTYQQDQITAAQAKATTTKSPSSKSPARTKPSPSTKPTGRRDDLGRISGIGPKIQVILADKRITTFHKLASTKVTRLEKILESAGPSFRRYDPSSWPEQAKLAAEQRWYELTLLQKQIARRS